MIYNMHIRGDFDRWIETPKKRVTTLCGKITATKYAGIPGVTADQYPGVWNDGKDVGWCVKCCANFLEEFDNNDFMHSVSNNTHVYSLYYLMIKDCIYQIQESLKAATSSK